MKAWLRRIDLSSFAHELLPLEAPGTFTIGRSPKADLRVDAANVSRLHCRLSSNGGPWQLEDLSAGGILIDERRATSTHQLVGGDALVIHDQLFVFVDRPEARAAPLEAAIDEKPDDAARILVWADWLTEHGDPLGEDLVRDRRGGPMLEGLQRHVDAGRLELVWRHGLIHTARLRTTEAGTIPAYELLARLLRVRVCRWVRELVVDTAPQPTSPTRVETAAAATLRVLLAAGPFPALERLALGYTHQALGEGSFLPALVSRLRERLPRLRDEVLPPRATHAFLDVLAVGPGTDFHHEGASDAVLPLDAGIWVGSSRDGELRAVSPGMTRPGLTTSFVVGSFSVGGPEFRWVLYPSEPTLMLNGHRAVPVHLLPGDLLEDSRGMRYRFRIV